MTTIRTICLLTISCSLAAIQPVPVLTFQEAALKISEYTNAQEVIEAHFPSSLSTSPILINSARPAPVSPRCLASWRDAFEELTSLTNYLSGFHEVDDRLAITTSQLTAQGREFFRPLMPGSFLGGHGSNGGTGARSRDHSDDWRENTSPPVC